MDNQQISEVKANSRKIGENPKELGSRCPEKRQGNKGARKFKTLETSEIMK